MPLFVDPSSTCDTCLLPYVFVNNVSGPDYPRAPHLLVGCGHIFCLGCLEKITSAQCGDQPVCPLCRDPFDPRKITRLFVTSASGEVEHSIPVEDARRRLDSAVGMMNTRAIPGVDLVGEMQEFLQTVTPKKDQNMAYASALHAMAGILDRYIEVHQDVARLTHTMSQRDHDRERSAAANHALVQTLMDDIESVEYKLECFARPPSTPASCQFGRESAEHITDPSVTKGRAYCPDFSASPDVHPGHPSGLSTPSPMGLRNREQRLEQYRARAADRLMKEQMPISGWLGYYMTTVDQTSPSPILETRGGSALFSDNFGVIMSPLHSPDISPVALLQRDISPTHQAGYADELPLLEADIIGLPDIGLQFHS